ncbi:MAG: GNAT family N-acetyltransferase [Janthinobacterium lividum]
MVEVVPLAQIPDAAVEALLDRAFAPGRRARTAYRIRAGLVPIPALSFAALDHDVTVGTIQCWPVTLTGEDGRGWPLVMLGPVAVEPVRQGTGVGRLLIARVLAAAAGAGLDGAIMLIGDPDYYGPFGFTAERTARWSLPGPFEPHRLLARGAAVPAVAGALGPRGFTGPAPVPNDEA